jgi:hypothetical protein
MPESATETARELGKLAALLESLNARLDRQLTDFAAVTRDHQAQLHEVKHDMRSVMQQNIVVAERLQAHCVRDEDAQKDLQKDLTEIKGTSSDNQSKLADLLTWRGKVLGGLAVVVVLLSVVGHYVSEALTGLLHFLSK